MWSYVGLFSQVDTVSHMQKVLTLVWQPRTVREQFSVTNWDLADHSKPHTVCNCSQTFNSAVKGE